MKTDLSHIKNRVNHPFAGYGDERNGCFVISSPINSRGEMFVIFSDGGGWEHVSVSLKSGKIPNWEEMCFVKDLIFDESETVVQFHPKKVKHVNNAEVLHLWKQTDKEYELPPMIMV